MTKRLSATTEEERQGLILLLLAKSDCTASDRVLVSALNRMDIHADLETVRQDMAALEAQGLVTVETFDGEYAFRSATITKIGRGEAKAIEETSK